MNIHYIRAAITDRTGVFLSLEETRDILIEEGLLTASQAERLVFNGYSGFYKYEPTAEEEDVKDLLAGLEDEQELIFDEEGEIIINDEIDPENIIVEDI